MAEEHGRFADCPVCGKRFYMQWPGGWAYRAYMKRRGDKMFCSWSCMRKAQSEIKHHRYVKKEESP